MFLEKLDRPDVDELRNVRPAIALEQRNPVRTSRSTVGTVSEIYDYLRLLFARIGRIVCPTCGSEVKRSHPSSIADDLLQRYPGKKDLHPVPGSRSRRPARRALLMELQSKGFGRIKLGDEIVETCAVDPAETGPDRAVWCCWTVSWCGRDARARLVESLETALREGKGEVLVEVLGERTLRFSQALACAVLRHECSSLRSPFCSPSTIPSARARNATASATSCVMTRT